MKRPLPTPVGDVALLATRVLLGVIMLAHGYQKLVVNGIGRTTAGFESMSIPLAIVSASFVTVVELVGGTLLILGLLTTVVAGLHGLRHGRGGGFVHVRHGVFVSCRRLGAGRLDRRSAAGAGRGGPGPAQPRAPAAGAAAAARRPRSAPPAPAPVARGEEAIPPPGLPVTPLIRARPAAAGTGGGRHPAVFVRAGAIGAGAIAHRLPLRHQ